MALYKSARRGHKKSYPGCYSIVKTKVAITYRAKPIKLKYRSCCGCCVLAENLYCLIDCSLSSQLPWSHQTSNSYLIMRSGPVSFGLRYSEVLSISRDKICMHTVIYSEKVYWRTKKRQAWKLCSENTKSPSTIEFENYRAYHVVLSHLAFNNWKQEVVMRSEYAKMIHWASIRRKCLYTYL